jgi:uncharacterized protein
MFTKMLRMCAGRTGQILNMASLANDIGMDQKTIASWLGVLQSSFIVYLLKPYYNNFNKRITKTPKLYFYDTGLACSLLGIKTQEQIEIHSSRGALFENLIVSELLKNRHNTGKPDNLYYWRDKTGNEVDVLIEDENKLTAIEIKSSETIANDFFKGLQYFSNLEINSNDNVLIYGGNEKQRRTNGIMVKPWSDL